MGMIDLKHIDSMRKTDLNQLSFAVSELQRLKAEEERISKSIGILMREVIRIEHNIVEDPPSGISKNAIEVLDAWNNSGFSSEVVKNTVAIVRQLFFDDKDEAYQKVLMHRHRRPLLFSLCWS